MALFLHSAKSCYEDWTLEANGTVSNTLGIQCTLGAKDSTGFVWGQALLRRSIVRHIDSTPNYSHAMRASATDSVNTDT